MNVSTPRSNASRDYSRALSIARSDSIAHAEPPKRRMTHLHRRTLIYKTKAGGVQRT